MNYMNPERKVATSRLNKACRLLIGFVLSSTAAVWVSLTGSGDSDITYANRMQSNRVVDQHGHAISSLFLGLKPAQRYDLVAVRREEKARLGLLASCGENPVGLFPRLLGVFDGRPVKAFSECEIGPCGGTRWGELKTNCVGNDCTGEYDVGVPNGGPLYSGIQFGFDECRYQAGPCPCAWHKCNMCENGAGMCISDSDCNPKAPCVDGCCGTPITCSTHSQCGDGFHCTCEGDEKCWKGAPSCSSGNACPSGDPIMCPGENPTENYDCVSECGYNCCVPKQGGGGGGGGGGGSNCNDLCHSCWWCDEGEGCVEGAYNWVCDCYELQVGNCEPLADPIVVDLDGTGFPMTDTWHGVLFDFFGKGSPVQLSWTQGSTNVGWLVLDNNGNGVIDNALEMFSNVTPQPGTPGMKLGFKALALYDLRERGGNGDGWITQRDPVFARLRICVDRNHNGVSDRHEMLALSQARIDGFALDYKETKWVDAFGNKFRYRARVRTKDKDMDRWAYDVVLVGAW